MPEQEFNAVFSKRLRYYLNKYEITQAELAKRLGVGTTSVYNWCNGIKAPRMDKVDAMCDLFHCKRSDLIEEKDENSLPSRDERDISRRLERTLADLEGQQGALMFDGAPLDDETKELLKASLEHSIRVAKINAKKFTNKRYLNSND